MNETLKNQIKDLLDKLQYPVYNKKNKDMSCYICQNDTYYGHKADCSLAHVLKELGGYEG